MSHQHRFGDNGTKSTPEYFTHHAYHKLTKKFIAGWWTRPKWTVGVVTMLYPLCLWFIRTKTAPCELFPKQSP
jgi:hypothetical protein